MTKIHISLTTGIIATLMMFPLASNELGTKVHANSEDNVDRMVVETELPSENWEATFPELSAQAQVALAQPMSATPAVTVKRVKEQQVIGGPSGLVFRTPSAIPSGTLPWMAKIVDNGKGQTLIKEFDVTYDEKGNVLSKVEIKSAAKTLPATPKVAEFGATVAQGNYFKPWFTHYGVDCDGCSGQNTGYGNTATGLQLDINKGVKQLNGSWQPGIKWEGYFVVAADRNIPFCSILEITNHSYSGSGATPGVPIRAIVMDRGGAINENHLDLYAGSEASLNKYISITDKSRHNPIARIVRLGGGRKDGNGNIICSK